MGGAGKCDRNGRCEGQRCSGKLNRGWCRLKHLDSRTADLGRGVVDVVDSLEGS